MAYKNGLASKLEGSYFNVMGLPTHLVYETLNSIAEK